MKLTLIAFAGLFVATAAFAHPGHDHKAPQMPKEFDTMKGLVGNWEGTGTMGPDKKEMPVTTQYELTSGGTAIAEKLSPGTPHEMISMFHKEGKTMAMTHYCALGNQPHMKLTKADGKTMTFEEEGHQGLDSPKEMHMHSLTITLTDADNMKEEWTSYNDGKAADTAVFNFHRKK